MNKYRYFIGIDPDVDKSGYAVWDKAERKFNIITSYKFFELISQLSDLIGHTDTMVLVEAGWENKKSNWHGSKNAFTAQRIAKNVGENHRVGKLIAEYLQLHAIPHILKVPKNKKTTEKEFYNYTKIKERNQDKRDAAMLVFGM